MPRPKKSETDTASIVGEEKTTIETENPVLPESEPKVEKVAKPSKKGGDEAESERRTYADNEKVVIKCAACAGKTIALPTRTVSLDESGCCEVTGAEANRLLTIPGYELSK